MPGLFNIFLNIYLSIAKSRLSFSLCCLNSFYQIMFGLRYTHPFSAPPGRCLDHHRVSYFFSNFKGLIRVTDDSFTSGDNRYLGLNHCFPGNSFCPHIFQGLSRGSNEFYPTFLTNISKFRIFRQKPVSRMNSVHSRHLSRTYDVGLIQVAAHRLSRTYTKCLISKFNMK